MKEKFEIIRVRVTELEKFLSPPLYEASQINKVKIFADWKHLWSVIQWYLINPQNRWDIRHIYHNLVQEYERINDLPQLCEWLDPLVALQNEMCINIEMWDYLVVFEWTLDWIALGSEGRYIVDIKTAKAARDEQMLLSRYQCVFYVALWNIIQWIDEWTNKFEYRIFIKNKKKWRMQRLVRYIDVKQAKKTLLLSLKSYIWKHGLIEKK